MNKLQNIYFLVFLFLTMVSCKDKEPVGVDAGNGMVTAKIDGSNWQSKDTDNGAVYVAQLGTHIIQAEADDGTIIILTILSSISNGDTFDTSAGLFQPQYKLSITTTDVYFGLAAGGSGSITFTTFSDKKVAGTFKFTGVRTLADGSQEEALVTSGVFDIDI